MTVLNMFYVVCLLVCSSALDGAFPIVVVGVFVHTHRNIKTIQRSGCSLSICGYDSVL